MSPPGRALGDRGPVVVVGGGPAGSLQALYLARAGHEVTVYERRPDLRRVDVDSGRSINLALATRGIVPLRELGLLDRVGAITVPMAGRLVHAAPSPSPGDPGDVASGHAPDRGAPDPIFQPYGTGDDEVIHSVSRSDLNAILLDAAEATGRVELRFGHRCRGVDLERGILHLEVDGVDSGPDVRGGPAVAGDGQSPERGPDTGVEVPFGTVFGCDGANSAVRRYLVSANGGRVDVERLDHGYKELILPPTPAGGFRLDPGGLHIWPRGDLMLIALPNPEGDFTVTLFMPETGSGDSFEAIDTAPAVEAFFRREFPDVWDLIPDLTDQYLANPTGRLGTVRTTRWALDDRAVLVGDAAHAIVPFHGQGMNAAMESCRLLDQALAHHPDDTAAAFAAFEARRKPDADAIAAMAFENYEEMRAGVIDPDYRIRRQLALELSRRRPDRIGHRYGMVMFTTMPYAEVRIRARRQEELLSELTAGVDSLDDIDLDRASDRLVSLGPLPDWE